MFSHSFLNFCSVLHDLFFKHSVFQNFCRHLQSVYLYNKSFLSCMASFSFFETPCAKSENRAPFSLYVSSSRDSPKFCSMYRRSKKDSCHQQALIETKNRRVSTFLNLQRHSSSVTRAKLVVISILTIYVSCSGAFLYAERPSRT